MEGRNDSGVAQLPRKNRDARGTMLSQNRRKEDIINSSDRENALAVRSEGSKVSRGTSGQRSKKRTMRIKAVRKFGNRTIEVATNGNPTMPVVEHKMVKVLPKSRAFISLRKVNSNKVNPFTLEVN